MATDINLLPGELKPKGYALKLSKSLRKIAVLSAILFSAGLILYVGSNVLFSVELGNIKKSETKLIAEIKVMEQTEQKLVLIEDRLEKINNVISGNNSDANLNSARAVAEKTESGVTIDRIAIIGGSLKVSISSPNSSNISKFFRDLTEMNFKNIEVGTFNYDIDRGYKVELALNN